MYLKLQLQYFAQEKTEKATPKKRQDSRKKGQVAKSTDVNTAFILLFVFLSLWFAGSFAARDIFTIGEHTFSNLLMLELTPGNVEALFLDLLKQAALIIGPFMLAAVLAAVFSNYIQVGFLYAPEAIRMKLSKINPINGFKRIYSVRALVEFLKSMLKITLVGLVTFAVIWFAMDDLMKLSLYSTGDSIRLVGNLTIIMGLAAAFLLVFLSVPDYLYQKYDHEKNIRMSKQEVKDEHKKAEGDPLIRSRVKEKQRQLATSRMMQEVPKADVVITNPTHYAIALKYEEGSMDAPVVTARGVDFVALKLIGVAKNSKVPTVENRPLARALYSRTDVGDQVPEDLFKAVAEVLAYVYRLEKKL
ncbi:flagellar biosynthesis protein FlhB [Alteribacter natronophilus]|uniref:flagellar biosynthesis protein FlhB n=1 Tax=Alteribacter natronophilus TaxID=2583810 RepID=UPI00110DB30C|nr:flagellar biosynthesis protein FlhB [Alteribacter natronophilus]TMW73228.1 flagellar biosynthesis protein FlhB [Alteribacter natronophilus]